MRFLSEQPMTMKAKTKQGEVIGPIGLIGPIGRHVHPARRGQRRRRTPEPQGDALTLILARHGKLTVPRELMHWWIKHWSLDRRMEIAAQLKAAMQAVGWEGMPQSACSGNVEPFGYGSAKAHAIANAAGGTKLHVGSEGMIWKGRLWYWSAGLRIYWTRKAGERRYACGKGVIEILSRVIYEDHHGVKLSREDVIRLKDGNPNNLDPANMERTSMREMGPRNSQARSRRRRAEADADSFFIMTGAAGKLTQLKANTNPNPKSTPKRIKKP